MAISGDRSPLFYWGGGAAKPLSTGTYAGPRSLLAFWLGGACGWTFVPKPVLPYVPGDLTGGIAHGKHRRGREPQERYWVNDEEEILDFLRLWTIWNDNE